MNRFGRILLLCLWMTVIGKETHLRAQSFAPTERSGKFLDDAVCDSILRSVFLAYGASQGLHASDIDSRYALMRPTISRIVSTQLLQSVHKLDPKYGTLAPGSSQEPIARAAYHDALREVAELMVSRPQALAPLFSINHSDRILSFIAELNVAADGTIRVKETIRIYNGNGQSQSSDPMSAMSSDNNDIQRGIVRDFPTRYLDKDGYWTTTGFTLKGVTVNGSSEAYVEEILTNGIRIKIGKAEAFLPEGIFTYVIEYETHRQVIFHPDKDELYWNVNGNGWVFTADTVACRLRFPAGAEVREFACYTGPAGSTARDCEGRQEEAGAVYFQARQRLAPYEGLTVAAAIQKGVLQAPGSSQGLYDFLRANYILPLLAAVLAFLSIFFGFSWYRHGRDPKKDTIIPRFEPPAGMTPAETGYLLRQGYDSKLFAATLVDAAVHRDLDITVAQEGKWFKSTVYQFTQPAGGAATQSSARAARYGLTLGELYGQEAERGKYNPVFKRLNTQLETWLRNRMQVKREKGTVKGYFALNRGYNALGFVVLLLAGIAGVVFTAMHYTPRVFTLSLVLFLASLVVTVVFSILMKSYTKEGRKLTDEILGFRLYLDTAEQAVYQQLTPPEKTLELFEKYLPYAIALNVENHWAEQFDTLIQQAISTGYQPAYYRGSMMSVANFNVSSFSSGISSGLSSTISSASTPPSSSSGGSSGGGSSGGGGGGGGGGGW